MIRQGPGWAWFLWAALAALVMPQMALADQAAPAPECPAGHYQGSAMEIAAELILDPDGRYSYGLAYGALDETSNGRWLAGEGGVLLTSDPVKTPRFVVQSKKASKDDWVRIALNLPQGMSSPYLDAQVLFEDGTGDEHQFSTDFLEIELGESVRPKSIRPVLSIFGVMGEWLEVPPTGGVTYRIKFEPNDLGKVAFDKEPFAFEDGKIRLSRYGRSFLLHRFEGDCQPS